MKKLLYLSLPLLFIYSCNSGNTETPDSQKGADSTSTKIIEKNPKAVEFESLDGLIISGNMYRTEQKVRGQILLCHQARFSKFEYEGIAQRLNEMGFNCLAIDQRSGGPIANQVNETNLRAKEQGLGVEYLDARQDIKAAIDYLASETEDAIILWGSSYSSTLALYEAYENEKVKAVVSFSPGNYFADTLGSLVPLMAEFEKPMFLTSGNWEAGQVSEIIEGKELNSNQVQFIPEAQGHHGSRALWAEQDGGEEYWTALEEWLDQF
ncbi:MAG: hypothetical protein MI810_19670 [Flavobacteriales bacterium]|nr:hypothetical protein [Flavobacteriales bacterium]